MGKSTDLVGKKFGLLTVVEKTPERQDRYCLWRCSCACGGEILVNTKNLKRGTVTNCGCIPKKTAVKMKSGHELQNRDHKKSQRGSGLKGDRIVDLKGKRFGRLLVLYPTEKRDSKGSVFWHCLCDCGNETDVTEDGLVYGNYRSCGCLKKEIQKDIVNKLHHIDGTCVEWLEKRKSRSDNTSGFRGVYKRKNGSYRVDIGFKKHRYYLGTFKTYEEAVRARLAAETAIHERFVEAYYIWKQRNDILADDEKIPFEFEVKKIEDQFVVTTNIETYSLRERT